MRRFARYLLFVLLTLSSALPARGQYASEWARYVPDPAATTPASFLADDLLRFVPAIAGLGLGEFGVEAEHPFVERLAVTATSGIAVIGSVYALKYLVHRERPYGQGMDSFPSGHTALAFWGAEIVREEYGWGWGIGAYTLATGVAILRVYHSQHWETDVLAGAAIGVLSARLGYLLLPWERRIFGWDATTTIAPSYNPRAGAVQLNISKYF